ncbi:MAG: NAD-dependent epimerase/dehydratase family protein, partial [Planctomycetota bacterium]
MIHIGWHRMEQSRAVNVDGTRRLASACVQLGIRLVHVSTVDTLPAARSAAHPVDEQGCDGVQKVPCAYVVTKREAEQVVRELVAAGDLDAVIVHPGFMLGPYDWKPSSGRMLLEVSRLPVVAAPRGGCSVCDARDVAAGIANAIDMGEPGESYILAGENISYQDLWKHILRVAGKRPRVFRLGPGVHWFGRIVDVANRLLPLQERDVNGAMIAMG